jgi:UBX domain-containing protein 1
MSDPKRSAADKDEEDKKKKANTYYAGNGQAVEGAPNPAEVNSKNTVDDLFNKARENGAKPPEEHTSHRLDYFTGTGRRLGHTPGQSLPVQPDTRGEKTVKVAFYRNGFTVDGGDLRDPASPEGRAFLEVLNRGFVPKEIADKNPNTDITVSLEDRSSDDYVKQFKAFEGGGNRLAAPAPAGVGADHAAERPAGKFDFAEGEPSSKVVLQLPDGTKKEVKVNQNRHTVADIRGVVAEAAYCSPSDFDLILRERPPRTLDNPRQTLAEAKAFNCIIVVKQR